MYKCEFGRMLTMKNGITFPIAVVAFVVGAFTPYFYLNNKIDETNSKVDTFIESVKVNSQKTEDYQPVVDNEIESNTPSDRVNDVSGQDYNESASVHVSDTTNL